MIRLFCRVSFLVSSSVFLMACSSLGTNNKASVNDSIQQLRFTSPSAEQRVIIYNHGISRPQQKERCYLSYNKPPASLTALIDDKTMIYNLCSTSTESPAITSAGKQVYLRKIEIDFAIDAFLARGIDPKHIFLAGHSNGAWTSLMMMREVNKRFNGVIGFAPAFAGKRKEVTIAPWWRKSVRPKQIKDMLGASRMDALIFAYDNDAYNRPQDLEFLQYHYPLTNHSGVDLVSYDCGLRNAHQTYRKDCRQRLSSKKIAEFIQTQIEYGY